MSSNRNETIAGFIDRLSGEIALARDLSLTQTAQILEMAKLDLRTILHSISDEELRIFTRTLAEAVCFEGSKH